MNKIYCFIGITLLLSSFYMSFDNKDTKIIEFREKLNDKQKKIYDEITKERLNIYIAGIFIGLLCGYLYYLKFPKEKYMLCKIIGISIFVKLCFYKIYPKKPLMLYSLTTKDQVKAWTDVYTTMKKKWLTSIIFGSIGSFIISYSFIK